LKPGMALEGVVTNVTAFGAFVDVGVHQDGLVHVSQLSDRFVKDPSEVVKVGDKVTVRVLEVDLVRKRVALTRKSAPVEGVRSVGLGVSRARDQGTARGSNQQQREQQRSGPPPAQGVNTKASHPSKPADTFSNNPFAKHFRK
jgi:protein Tex